jgi:hypothetical protein
MGSATSRRNALIGSDSSRPALTWASVLTPDRMRAGRRSERRAADTNPARSQTGYRVVAQMSFRYMLRLEDGPDAGEVELDQPPTSATRSGSPERPGARSCRCSGRDS